MFDKIKKANEINDSIIQKVEQEKNNENIINYNNYEFNNINNNQNIISDEKEEEPEIIMIMRNISILILKIILIKVFCLIMKIF